MSDRLRLAVENGHVVLPSEGNILLIGAHEDTDFAFFDSPRTKFRCRSYRACREAERAGVHEPFPNTEYAGAVVFLPRARDEQRASIRFARSQTAGPIVVDGNKTDGVEALLREVRGLADVSEPWSKSHGKVFSISGGEFGDWPVLEPHLAQDGWWRAPGVFSADGIDPASAFLAENLPASLPGTSVDLGAGWGFLARAVLERANVEKVILVEDDILALTCALRNLEHFSAEFEHSDALTWQPTRPVDHVVTNPPFHVGRAADPSLGQGFIRAAARMLKPKGHLWLVANRHLPYEGTLKDAFRTVELHAENPSFKIFHATSPTRLKGK